MSKEKGNISAFQRYLTVWVILCMVIGVLIGKYLPINTPITIQRITHTVKYL